MTVYHVLVGMLAMRQDLLFRIDYVQLDIFVDVVRIVPPLILGVMPIFAHQGIIVQKVSLAILIIIILSIYHYRDHHYRDIRSVCVFQEPTNQQNVQLEHSELRLEEKV